MNIEETIEILKKYISFSEKECNFPSIWDWNWHMELANDIETLLTAYEKEKETSHYIQSQLDIANAKLVEEKEKNKKIKNELEKHIKFCEQEAEGSLNNEICNISLRFNKKLLNILKGEE